MTKKIRTLFVSITCGLLLAGCKIEVPVPSGGYVTTQSGTFTCNAGQTCVIEATDLTFDETFIAVPDDGMRFMRWKKRDRGFFGGSSNDAARLFTAGFEGNEILMLFLKSDDVFYLEPVFEKAVNANLFGQLQASYQGQMRSPRNVFFLDSTTLTLGVDDNTVDISKEAFFGRTCLLDGILTGEGYPIKGDGAFKCSDFSAGTWTAPTIAKIDETTIFATFFLDDGVAPYQIKFGGFGSVASNTYSPGDDYWLRDAPLSDFSGSYEGEMSSTDSCAGSTFQSSSAELNIKVDTDTVEITRDSFFDGVCEFSGTKDSFTDGVLRASGTFRCSNFDEGTWTGKRISMVDSGALFAALTVNVPARGCSFTARHIVFKKP